MVEKRDWHSKPHLILTRAGQISGSGHPSAPCPCFINALQVLSQETTGHRDQTLAKEAWLLHTSTTDAQHCTFLKIQAVTAWAVNNPHFPAQC